MKTRKLQIIVMNALNVPSRHNRKTILSIRIPFMTGNRSKKMVAKLKKNE